MQKCLIVQFEPRHEEVIPSLIATCNAAGYRPTVLLNRRIRRVRGDVFDLVKGGVADIEYASLSTDPAEMDWTPHLADAAFVVLNTLSRPRVARWAKNSGKPVIALVHNVDQFTKDPKLAELLAHPDFAFATLAPHVTVSLNAATNGAYMDRIATFGGYHLTDTPHAYAVSNPRKVVVMGNLSLRSRNYGGLIETLAAHPGRWDNLVFEFPSSGADLDEVAQRITAQGLDDRITILPPGAHNQVPHKEVFDSFRSATFFHPLIPEGFAQYQRIKTTSTALVSVGFGVPTIMDRYSHACYRFPMLVADNSIEATLDVLSSVPDETLHQINADLTAYRAQSDASSAREMARLIDLVTGS